MKLPKIPLSTLISYIEEDTPFGDITSEIIIEPVICQAEIICREDIILAGMSEMELLAQHYEIQVSDAVRDGEKIQSGSCIARWEGDAHAILLIERTVLNILGRMSGIATRTRNVQDMISRINPDCKIAATRKTAPGLRLIDKKAAMIGGADPHRFSLSDAILIKDNHRALVPLETAIKKAKESGIYHLIEAEVESSAEAIAAIKAGAHIILIDNMTPSQAKETMRIITTSGLRHLIKVEVSGGINEETAAAYAALPIDRISMGSLTHSVRNADFSLEIIRNNNV